jgi:hypothetical protein
VALAASGYEDVVAFEDADQLLAHHADAVPALAVVDAWTARFDHEAIRHRLTATRVILLTSEEPGQRGEDWGGAYRVPKPRVIDELGRSVIHAISHSSDAGLSVAAPTSVNRTLQRAPTRLRRR